MSHLKIQRSVLAMARRFAAAVVLVLSPGPPVMGASLPDTIDRVRASIIAIGTMLPTRRPAGHFVGTGFVVADGRHVITNAHNLPDSVDAESREFLAILTPGRHNNVRRARLVDADRKHDLALLAFEGEALPAMEMGDSSTVREGELYAFTGFPIGMVLGMRPVTHRGIVSAITPIAIPQISPRQLDAGMIARLREPYDVFQLDATAYPGNSGSPLYDASSGVVIGIVNKVFVKESKEKVLQDPSGISYAIPAHYARALLERHGLASSP